MGKLMGRLLKQAQEYDRDELKDRPTHSHAYHVFFRGYSERRVRRKNGNGYRIERVYTADYRKYEETDLMWRGKKFYYLLAYIAAVGIFIFGASSVTAYSSAGIIGVAEGLALLSIVYLGYSMVYQLLAKRLMTMGEYSAASVHLKWSALVTSCLSALVLVIMFIFKCASGFRWNMNDFSALGGMLGTAFVCFLMFRMESMRDTQWVKNHNVTPEDGIEIW